jgi:histidyl-tRNA synthetase
MTRDPSLIQSITGFPEWLPSERLVEVRFIDTIRKIFEAFGFAPIETPAVEKTATLETKGEVNKQIYSLLRPNVPDEVDKEEAVSPLAPGGKKITGLSLHFDLTVPLARYVAQHYGKLVFPFRRYQIQKVWRGERAQRGRFREFYQCDIDIVGDGSLDLMADAEMPVIIYEVFTALNLGKFVIRISNRKILQGLMIHYGVEGDRAEETLRAIDRLPKLRGGWEELAEWLSGELSLPEDLIRMLKDFLSVGTIPETALLEHLNALPVTHPVFRTGISELETVLNLGAAFGVPAGLLEVDLSITRGLDYYTGTVYETFLIGQEKTLGSICSGGRYENLASHFIDRNLPGVGVSIGLSRLLAALFELGIVKPDAQTPAEVMVTIPDRSRMKDSFVIAGMLRKRGLRVELFAQDLKHDKQLKLTVRKGIPYAVIPWPDKLDGIDSVEVRNLVNGKRETVARDKIAEYILRK